MKKTLLWIAIILIGIGLSQKSNQSQTIEIIPDNIPVVPEPVLENNIIHDDIELAKKLSITHNRKLIIIFGADWCPYCHKLKNDLGKYNTTKYILCIINVDKNKELAQKYKLKILPTSIVCDNELKETGRKTGYISQEYASWLESN